MQELGRHRPVTAKSAAIQRYLLDGHAFERSAGPAVQLLARDSFVAETAVKLDHLVGEIKALSRELALVKSDIAELRDESARAIRFSEFLDREHKSRSAKLDDLARRFDYLKARVEKIDGKSDGDYHAFRNFEQVSRRLTELGSLERAFHDVDLKLKLGGALFLGSLVGWIVVLAFG